VQAGAVHQPPAPDLALGRLQHERVAVVQDAPDPRVEQDLPARGPNDLGVGRGHGGEVDHARVGDVKAGNPRRVRLVLAHLLRRQAAKPLEAVGPAPALQLIEPGNLLLARGHHDLAALSAGDPVLVAEPVERLAALDAQPGLPRVGAIVQARVYDTAVVAALVRGEAVLGLQHQQRRLPGLGQGHGRGQAHDPPADDCRLALPHAAFLCTSCGITP
jgi:hypothetical protein